MTQIKKMTINPASIALIKTKNKQREQKVFGIWHKFLFVMAWLLSIGAGFGLFVQNWLVLITCGVVSLLAFVVAEHALVNSVKYFKVKIDG